MEKSFLIGVLGSQARISEALDIEPPSVSKWGETLPDSAVGRIARLRPDLLRLWWRHQRTASKPGIRRNDTHAEHVAAHELTTEA